MKAVELLALIDLEYERAYGRIRIPKYGGSNMYMNILEHRRWMHPRWQEYLDLKKKEEDAAKR